MYFFKKFDKIIMLFLTKNNFTYNVSLYIRGQLTVNVYGQIIMII